MSGAVQSLRLPIAVALLFEVSLLLAIQRMSRGASVQQVALDLGYTSSSSFVTMFRKALGTSTARYMAHRLIQAEGQN